MPSGPRIRANNVMGTITNDPLTIGATSFNSALLALMPTVAAAHAVVTFDPLRQYGEPEIAIVTIHTAAATVANITRGAYGTAAREHPFNTIWIHAALDEDDTEILTSGTRPSDPYEGQMIYETDTESYKSFNGTSWVDLSVVSGGGGFPVAMIVPTGAAAAPSGWLMCEGAEVLGTTYPALAAELGTGGTSRFGSATAGNIKLPDLRGKFPLAVGGTVGAALAAAGGSKDAAAISHNHTQNGHNHTQNIHGHSADDNTAGAHEHDTPAQYVITHNSGGGFNFNVVSSADVNKNQEVTFTDPTSSAGSHDHNITVVDATATNIAATATNQASGASGTNANLPPYLAVNYMIKAH